MFKKINELAEQTATSVSRRQFLTQFGGGAMTLTAAVGGWLALPAVALGKLPPPAACGADSALYCQGLVEGAYCQIGTTPGTCVGAPACTCVPTKPRRPPRR
jgi:hypothetical protein